MKSRKNQEQIARYLFKNSLTEDSVDAVKVTMVLDLITKQRPPQLIKILKIYKKMIERALSREELIIETAAKISDNKFESVILKKTRAKRIKYKINPNLVLGMKITHGDWVYDETLPSKLKQFTQGY